VFRYLYGVHARDVAHHHAVIGGGPQVHAVHPHAVAADGLAFGQVFYYVARGQGRQPHEDTVGVPCRLNDLVLRRTIPLDNLYATFLEDGAVERPIGGHCHFESHGNSLKACCAHRAKVFPMPA